MGLIQGMRVTYTIKKRKCYNDIDVDAESVFRRIGGKPGPEEADRRALEESDEEEDDAGQYGNGHRSVDDPLMNALHCYAKKEQSDGCLRSYHRGTVRHVT